MEKICNKCNEVKNLLEFPKCKACSNGVRNTCKTCTNLNMVSFRSSEDQQEKAKEYRVENREKQIEYSTRYNKKPEVKAKKRKYYDDNIEYYRDIEKTPKRKKYRYNYNKNSHIYRWRVFLSGTFKRLGKRKEGHTIDLLGYSALELKNHLESLFTEGMTWENYGEWHIDHIIALSKFNPDTPINIINALSNLQPLWATTREINGIIYIGNQNKYNK